MATVNGSNSDDNLEGTILADSINGKGGNDIIRAKAGGDNIVGGAGADRMFGEGGDDGFTVLAGDTAANEVYDGGNGSDQLLVSVAQFFVPFVADFSQSTVTSIESLRFFSSVADPVTALFKAASFGGTGLASDLQVTGSFGTDTIQIDMLNDTSLDLSGLTYVNWGAEDLVSIRGDDSAETIKGSWATDVIFGGLGADTILASGGDDIINANRTEAGDVYNGGTGFDTLSISNSFFDAGITDLTGATLVGIEALLFQSNSGGSGFMQAVFSADQFDNGEVSSSLLVQSFDPDIEQIKIVMGSDTFFSAANFTIEGFGASELVLIEGSAGNDSITGSSVNDEISASDGQDVLLGGAGDDFLDGGSGDDFMFGGAGNDTYVVAEAGDVAAEVLVGADPGGLDLVISEVDTTLNSFIEDLLLRDPGDIDGTGNGLGNEITGNNFANTLTGLAGNDRLIGSLGIDRLFGGTGNDRFIFNLITDSGVGSSRDRIQDFAAGDNIQLSGIDANETIAANQAFALDLDGSFSTGEIKLTINGANTIVGLNTDADAVADMQILVVDVTNLTAANFIL